MQNKITTIFFDLFGVLLGIDQSVVIQYLSKLTDTPYIETREIALGEPFMRLERGEVTFTRYVEDVRSAMPNGARIDVDNLREIWKNRKFSYHMPPQFPSMNRDIALQVKSDVVSKDLFQTIFKEGGDILVDVSLFDLYQAEHVGGGNKSLAFSLKFQSRTSTLKDSEVDSVINTILKSLHKAYGAIQR